MRLRNLSGFLFAALATAAGCGGGTLVVRDSSPQPAYAAAEPSYGATYGASAHLGGEPIDDVSIFYSQLEPHGQFTQHHQYGEVFIPRDPGYQPYTNGGWRMTDMGLTFVSDDPFGDVTSHYGRWVYDGRWVWIPGTEWAPANVAWVEYGDRVGWAPLPPDNDYSRIPDQSWAFVEADYLFAPDVHRHVRREPSWARSGRHIDRWATTPQGARYAAGPDRQWMERRNVRVRRFDGRPSQIGRYDDAQRQRMMAEAQRRQAERQRLQLENQRRQQMDSQRQQEALQRQQMDAQRRQEDAQRRQLDAQRRAMDEQRRRAAPVPSPMPDIRARQQEERQRMLENQQRAREDQQRRVIDQRVDPATRRELQGERRDAQAERREDQLMRRQEQQLRRAQQQERRNADGVPNTGADQRDRERAQRDIERDRRDIDRARRAAQQAERAGDTSQAERARLDANLRRQELEERKRLEKSNADAAALKQLQERQRERRERNERHLEQKQKQRNR